MDSTPIVLSAEQTAEIVRVRQRVRDAAFPAPAERQPLRTWAADAVRPPLAGVVTRVFGVEGDGRFSWSRFAGAVPYFEEPEGDFDEGTLILVASAGEEAQSARPLTCVVVPLDLGALRGRSGLEHLVDRVADGLSQLVRAAA